MPKPTPRPDADSEAVGSRPKPAARANLIHQQLLGGLIETRVTSWFRKTMDGDDVVKTKTPARSELVNPLAQNVSSENVERAMNRWIP